MVKNLKGGNKTKKQKRGIQETLNDTDEGQMFGQIIENKGSHFIILCADNVKRNGWLCNKMKKGQRLSKNSFVILSIRDYETKKNNCDVIGIANPSIDIKNIFKKINPIENGNYDNINFINDDDRFNELSNSNINSNLNLNTNSNININLNINSNINSNINVFGENNDWIDPNAKNENDLWSDLLNVI